MILIRLTILKQTVHSFYSRFSISALFYRYFTLLTAKRTERYRKRVWGHTWESSSERYALYDCASPSSLPCHRWNLNIFYFFFHFLKLNHSVIVRKNYIITQHAKKVVSDSSGLVDFAIGLVNSVFNLLDGQVTHFWGIRITEELWNQFGSSKSFWG